MGTMLGWTHPVDAKFFAPFFEALGGREDCEVLVSVGRALAESLAGHRVHHPRRVDPPLALALERRDLSRGARSTKVVPAV